MIMKNSKFLKKKYHGSTVIIIILFVFNFFIRFQGFR